MKSKNIISPLEMGETERIFKEHQSLIDAGWSASEIERSYRTFNTTGFDEERKWITTYCTDSDEELAAERNRIHEENRLDFEREAPLREALYRKEQASSARNALRDAGFHDLEATISDEQLCVIMDSVRCECDDYDD